MLAACFMFLEFSHSYMFFYDTLRATNGKKTDEKLFDFRCFDSLIQESSYLFLSCFCDNDIFG